MGTEIADDPHLGNLFSSNLHPDQRAVQMRLMRYARQGILQKRKSESGKGFEYRITERGEQRLYYLYEKFGDFDVTRSVMPVDEAVEKKERIDLMLSVLKSRRESYLIEKT